MSGAQEETALKVFATSLKQPAELRRDWILAQTTDNSELRAQVLRLYDQDANTSDTIKTGGALNDILEETDDTPSRIGNYKITKMIGRGGMGAVYLGERDVGDFAHRAAIKVVYGASGNERLSQRLRRERQTLADLQHPNIARLYDGGELQDGVPYFVMDYVEGVPLNKYLKDRAPSFEERLRLFFEIAEAVSFAHQNLIIHHDLSPSNAIVGVDGRVRLIDFGISQKIGIEEDGARTTMTKTYAAPERQDGQAATTLSDIYSLGVILDEMTDGVSMARESDLRAIIAKARNKAPEERYRTVDDLATDLRRFESCEPVGAVPRNIGYVAKRLFGRHPFSSAAACVAVVAVATAGLMLTLLYSQAEAARRDAERAREVAEARFADARTLNNKLLFDVYDQIAEIPGTLAARRNLADLLRGFTDNLATDPFAPDDILMDVGVNKARLADLYGGIGIPNLGDGDEALRLLEEAVTALEQLTARAPENSAAYKELMTAKRFLVVQYGEAGAEYKDKALAVSDALLQQAKAGGEKSWPEARAIRRIFWQARTDRLRLMLVNDHVAEALATLRQWRSEFTPTVQDSIDGGDRMAAFLAAREGELQQRSEAPDKAVPAYLTAISYYAAEVEKQPDHYYYNYTTALLHGELAGAYLQIENGVDALKYATLAVDGMRKLASLDAENFGADEHTAWHLSILGAAQTMAGDWRGAVGSLEEAISINRQLLQDQPQNESATDSMIWSFARLAQAHVAGGNIDAACRYREQTGAWIENAKSAGVLRPFTENRLPPVLESVSLESDCGPR